MNADTVEKIVESLMILKKTKSIDDINLMPEFNEFKQSNRMFYETILSGQMDMSIFKHMMGLKRKLEAGEDSYSVDVKFGKYMAEKYIDPVVKKL